jgi:hypothetical protein
LIALAAWIICGSALQAQSLGFVSLSAVVTPNGITTIGRGVQNSSRTRIGVYQIEFTRDVTSCTLVASVRGRKHGFASVRHPVDGLGGNFIRVFTFTPTGAAADLAFNVLVNCTS